MSEAFEQGMYQVRLEWGVDGMRRLAPADVVVVVDVLRFTTTVTRRVAAGASVPLDADAHAVSINGAAIAQAAKADLVLAGCLRNASAVAAAVLAEQRRRGDRTRVNIIAGGELSSRADGASMRFAVEDLLGAGAVVAALGERGIDHTSPEAAAAGEAFLALRHGVRHLVTNSGSGRELAERGQADEAVAAAAIDADEVVAVLRDGAFSAL